MKEILRDIKDMTDSREMIESKASPFVAIFIYLLLFIIIVALIWAYFGEKDEAVKATGVVRPNESVSTIQSKVIGNVEEIYYIQGQKVKQGDILFTLEKEDLKLQKDALLADINKLTYELEQLEKFKNSVIDGHNYFTEEEDYYYNQFLKYEIDYNKLASELALTSTELDKLNLELDKSINDIELKKENELNYDYYSKKLDETKEYIKNLELLELAIINNRNYFIESQKEFYNRYIDYELQYKQLEEIVNQKKEKYEIYLSLGEEYISKVQIEDERRQYELALLDLENYKNEYLLSLRSSIKEQEESKEELEVSIEKIKQDIEMEDSNLDYVTNRKTILEKEYNENSSYAIAILEKYKIDKIVELNERIKSTEDNLINLNEQLYNTEISIEDRIIRAPIDGTVNITTEINKGDLVAGGTEILKIVPESDSEYKVIISVLNQDINDIKVGDEIKYHFLALPYKEYGELTGEIRKISTDAIVNTQDGMSYYMVEASIENKPLYSYKGQEASIKVGMLSETYIVTDSKKVIYYLLEKIDLKD